MKTKLTSTRLTTLRKCRRLHFLRYELGFSRIRTATPLRFGSGFHVGLETHNRGATDQTVFECALAETKLPERPDYEAANRFLVKARNEMARKTHAP